MGLLHLLSEGGEGLQEDALQVLGGQGLLLQAVGASSSRQLPALQLTRRADLPLLAMLPACINDSMPIFPFVQQASGGCDSAQRPQREGGEASYREG